jgi:SAM-dependent methyltransferase
MIHMNDESKRRWDLKYEQGLPSLTRPDPFFVMAYERFVEPAFPNAGTALDLAGGLGRHALWLAQRNWQVSIVDVSDVALQKLREATNGLNLDLDLVLGDAADYNFELAQFDLIVLFYHLDRTLFPRIFAALRPGGLFLCKMRVRCDSEARPASETDQLLGRHELLSLLPGLVAIDYLERPIGDRGVVEFAGKKPQYSGRPDSMQEMNGSNARD